MASTSSKNSPGSALRMPNRKRRDFLNRATKEYAGELDQVACYLESRGITEATAQAWQLGFVSDPMPGHEEFKGRLAIPYLTPAGTMLFKFRCVELHDCKAFGCVKYLGEHGEQPRLFGVWNLRHDTSTLMLCEGELDTIVATQAGYRAVGVPGSTQFREYWLHLFEGYDEVILPRDGDAAGREMAGLWQGRLSQLRAVKMPEGQDVSSLYCTGGGEALRERIAA